MENPNIQNNLQEKYQEWRENYLIYKNLLTSQEVKFGIYSITVQEIFYSINDTLIIIQSNNLEKKEISKLMEFNDCILSIRNHILNFLKVASHPYDIETLSYLNSLFKRLKTKENTISDEELMNLHQKIMKEIKKNSPLK